MRATQELVPETSLDQSPKISSSLDVQLVSVGARAEERERGQGRGLD